MNISRAEQIVNEVASRHLKLKPIDTYLANDGGALLFAVTSGNPNRAANWFRACGYPVSKIGYDVKGKVWYLYFGEKEAEK